MVRGARFSSLCCWVSSAFLDVVLPWPSLATSDVPAYRETSRNMVANATARRWSPLAFSCDAVSRSDGVCLVLTRFCLFFGFLDHDGPRPPPHSAGAVFQRQVFSWFLLFATWAFGRAWEGAAFRSSLFVSSARRQLQLSFSLGCGYFLHSFVCCPASQYLRDCGRVLEQTGAPMAPAAAASIAGCPCSRAAAAPPLAYLI